MLLDEYFKHVDDLYAKIRSTQREAIEKAGLLLAETVENGGCAHVYDTGHIIDSELIYRGGGLLLLKAFKYGLSVSNNVRARDRSSVDTSMVGLAQYALKASGAMPGDIMFMGSVSGRGFSAVDLAIEAKKFGLKIVVITSMSYTTQVKSEHPSGLRLFELADVVLDNCAPAAEAMMEVEGLEPRLCAASGLSAAHIMWSVVVCAVEKMLADGHTPSVLKSANFPGGPEFNRDLEDVYKTTGF